RPYMATAALPKLRTKRMWTFNEMLAELPETNQPVELWDGEIVVSPSPNPDHQRLVLRFCGRLNKFVIARKLGEVFVSPLDVVLSQRRTVQPDIFFISHARREIVKDHIYGVPDLAIEIISEGTWERDRVIKKALYEQFGLRSIGLWILRAERSKSSPWLRAPTNSTAARRGKKQLSPGC